MCRARGDLGAAPEAGEMVTDVAIVLLDRGGQVLAGEQSFLRNDPLEPLPVVCHEDVVLDADPLDKTSTGRVITPTQLPGQGSPCHRVKGSPEPNLVFSRPRSATSRRSARCRPREWPKAPGYPRRPPGSTCRRRRGPPRAAWRSCPG